MAQYKQLPLPPEQLMLFGTSVQDALPQSSDVRSFNDVMECLDYSAIEQPRSGAGAPPYPPRQMVKILVYAYSKGIYSSRAIEENLRYDIRFIWLSGGLKPDHNTLARFRKDNYEHLTQLFKDSVRVCCKAGLVLLNTVAVDGTKIGAASSRRRIYNEERLERELAAVEKILAQADGTDRAEDESDSSSDDDGLPQEIKDAKARKARLAEIAKQLQESDRKSVVSSEPEARVVKTTDRTRPGYNLQASVDSHKQVIVAMKLIQHEVDTAKLPEMIEETVANTGLSPDVTLADCGYSDEPTLKWIAQSEYDVLMPVRTQYIEKRRRNNLFASRCFLPAQGEDALICPAQRKLTFRTEQFCGGGHYRQYGANDCQSCSFYRQCVKTPYGSRRVNVSVVAAQREQMTQRLASAEGRKLFGLRSATVEPVFGQIKHNTGFGRFRCWGLAGAKAEAALVSMAHNIRKCVLLLLCCILRRVSVFCDYSGLQTPSFAACAS
jgi:transposase